MCPIDPPTQYIILKIGEFNVCIRFQVEVKKSHGNFLRETNFSLLYIILYDRVFPILLNFHESSKMDNQILLKIAPIKKFSFLSSMEDWPVTFLILQRPFEILLGNYFNFVHSSNVFCHFLNVLHNRWPSCLFSVQTKEFCMHTIHSVSAHITQLSKFQSNRNIESNIIAMPCQKFVIIE